jgi:hypothetical protein
MIPILSQIKVVQILPPYSFKLHFNIMFSCMPLSSKWPSSGFPTKTLSALYCSSLPCALHVRPSKAIQKECGPKTTEKLTKSSCTSNIPMIMERLQHCDLLLTESETIRYCWQSEDSLAKTQQNILADSNIIHSNILPRWPGRTTLQNTILPHFYIPYLRVYKPHFFDRNSHSKIGMRLINEIKKEPTSSEKKSRYNIDDWAHDAGIVCCKTPSRDRQ